MKIKVKYNPNSIDVTDIVKQVRQHLYEKQQEAKTDDKIRLQAKQKLINKLNSLPFPKDVKDDLLKSNFDLIFDSDSLIRSERPFIGSIFKLTRLLFKPILKFIININPLMHFLHRQSYLIILYKELLLDMIFEIEKMHYRPSKKPIEKNKNKQFHSFKSKNVKAKSGDKS